MMCEGKTHRGHDEHLCDAILFDVPAELDEVKLLHDDDRHAARERPQQQVYSTCRPAEHASVEL